jgi:hypothetical protein
MTTKDEGMSGPNATYSSSFVFNPDGSLLLQCSISENELLMNKEIERSVV